MKINIIGHNVDVTPAIKSYTEEKFGKLERHFDHITAINVVLTIEKLNQIAEANVLVPKSDIHARAESENLYTAIDEMVDKLDRRLIKHKEKIRAHHD